MSSYLAASGLIIQRLKDIITDVPPLNIRAAITAEWAIKNALSPSLNVIFFDVTPVITPDSKGVAQHGKVQLAQQFWVVMLSVRNVADAGNAAQLDAGVLIFDVLKALLGWRPSKDYEWLHWQHSPWRKTERDGFIHYPLMFSTQTTVTGIGNA
jgi:hypothetical protein